MKKNTKKTEPPAAAAPAPQPAAPAGEQQTPKPEFYARLMASRPSEAASIMATLCRRKDKALRVMVDAYDAGKDTAECIRAAMAVAFPRKEATQPVASGVEP